MALQFELRHAHWPDTDRSCFEPTSFAVTPRGSFFALVVELRIVPHLSKLKLLMYRAEAGAADESADGVGTMFAPKSASFLRQADMQPGRCSMATLEALGSGLVGATALTAIHESARKTLSDAPRMNVLGERAIARSMEMVGREPPPEDDLHTAALFGDVVANSLYYSLVGLGDPNTAVLRGALLGLAAGLGGVYLPGPMGLGDGPSARTPATKAMTITWYVAGGIAAGIAFQLMHRRGR